MTQCFRMQDARWSPSVTEEYDHARHRECRSNRIQTPALEQGEADRGEATAAAKARLVHPNQLQVEGRTRDLAMLNLAIDSKLRGCDVVALKVEDVAPNGYSVDRATVRQKKTGQPVSFELTEQTRQAVDDYIKVAGKRAGESLFVGRRGLGRCMSTRQYARLVSAWIASIGLDPNLFGTHSLRRTKATLIYRRTGNLRAVQLLLGHTKPSDTSASRSMTPWP
jgi:integrase